MSVNSFLKEFTTITLPAAETDSIAEHGEWTCIRAIHNNHILIELEPLNGSSILLGLVQSFQEKAGKGLGTSSAFKTVAMMKSLADKHNVTLKADISPTDGQITPEKLKRLSKLAGFETTGSIEIDGATAYQVSYTPKPQLYN